MKKVFLTFLLTIGLISSVASTGQAAIFEFDALNKVGANYGVGFLSGGSWHLFAFNDVKMTIDSTSGGTGSAILAGDITHNPSGESWSIQASFDNLRALPAGGFPSEPVPFDEMFQELKSGGTLVWDDMFLELTPKVASPAFSGVTSYIGKSDTMGNPSILKYRKFGGPSSLDYWGLSAWFSPIGTRIHGGDIHLSLFNPREVLVPEPSTTVLMLVAFAMMTFFSRKKLGIVKK